MNFPEAVKRTSYIDQHELFHSVTITYKLDNVAVFKTLTKIQL